MSIESSNKNIVVIGAGYGGITAAFRLEKLFHKRPDFQVHLIDRNPYHVIKTRLHEAAVLKTDVSIPIESLLRRRKIRFHLDEVTGIDPDGRTVYMKSGILPFSFLVIALGSQTNFYGIPGLEEHSYTLETLRDADSIHDLIASHCSLASKEPSEETRRFLLRFVIGGGGLTGVEFAAELADYAVQCSRKSRVNPDEIEIVIVEGGGRVVPHIEESIAKSITEKLAEKKIKLKTGVRIVRATGDEVTLSTGEVLKTGTLIWTGGIRIADLLRESKMKTGHLGRIVVDEFLRAEGYTFIYAIGDNALAINPVTGKPVPPAAQFALQQGRLVADNIYADVTDGVKRPYRPRTLGEIVSLGRHLGIGWLALPLLKKITFAGFLGSLFKAAIQGRYVLFLRKESRSWVRH